VAAVRQCVHPVGVPGVVRVVFGVAGFVE